MIATTITKITFLHPSKTQSTETHSAKVNIVIRHPLHWMHALSFPTPPTKQTAREASTSTSPHASAYSYVSPSHNSICYGKNDHYTLRSKPLKTESKDLFAIIIKYIETHTHSLFLSPFFFIFFHCLSLKITFSL